MSLIKSSATIGSLTLVSRVLGFVRDMAIASSLGAGMLSDAFFVAFKLPNFLRRMFAEGAFSAAFVPIFAGMLAKDGKDKAERFASEAMSFLTLVLLITIGIMTIAMPWLMVILAPGFSDSPEKFDLTVTLSRITLPYVLFISLVSLLGGILNSAGRFAAAAATPILLNLSLILIPQIIDDLTPTMAHALAIAVTIAGLLQWLWLVYECRKHDMLPMWQWPRLTPEVKKLLKLIAPAALGAGVAQVNLFIDLIIASQFENGVSYLYYADRISQLPLGVIGIAVSTALLPTLSRQIREGHMEMAYRSEKRAIELVLFLSLPAALSMIILAEPIISVMFERGEFNSADTAATYPALIAFAAGLPAFVLVKILAPIFYAHQDTKTPFKIATFCIVINLIFNLLLMGPFRHVGMAMATSIASWVNVAIMIHVLLDRQWLKITRDLLAQIMRMVMMSAVMGTCVFIFSGLMQPWFSEGELIRFGTLIGITVVGIITYLIGAYTCNCVGIREQIRKRF